LAAKPIIDVQVSVRILDPVAPFRDPLEKLGFVFRDRNADLTKRYFRESPGERRTQLHVRQAGSWAEQFALLFRDYMRAHPDDATAYAEQKRLLADRYTTDRRGYTEAKADFLWPVMRKADAWGQAVGRVLGPSDAWGRSGYSPSGSVGSSGALGSAGERPLIRT
jgi:GrpB-like predicted nucleotidyltransferase (UPF0157 family)